MSDKRTTTTQNSGGSPSSSNQGRSSGIPKAPPIPSTPLTTARKSPSGGGNLQTQLTAELAARASRRSSHLSSLMTQSTFTDRPSKPDSLKANDTSGNPLTAHHMLPHSRIKSEFASAVTTQNHQAMQNLSTFGGNSMDSSDTYRQMAYYKSKPGQTKENLSRMYKAASWDANNVFMGPDPSTRTDDPGDSGVDLRRTKTGATSKASSLSQDLHTHGFGGLDPQSVVSRRAASKQEADTLRPYDASDWQSDGTRQSKKGNTIHLTKQK